MASFLHHSDRMWNLLDQIQLPSTSQEVFHKLLSVLSCTVRIIVKCVEVQFVKQKIVIVLKGIMYCNERSQTLRGCP